MQDKLQLCITQMTNTTCMLLLAHITYEAMRTHTHTQEREREMYDNLKG